MLKSHSEQRLGNPGGIYSKAPTGPANGYAILTVPYFSPACLAGFDARWDRGLEQVIYLQALIEEDGQPATRNTAATA